jgi:hypothetical protein
MLRTILLTLLAGAISFAVDVMIGTTASRFTRVPSAFPPFTLLPVLSGTFGGAILASIVYSILRASARNSDRVFLFITVAIFALSLGLPLRLSFTKSQRFAGATPSAQMVLILMHAVVATVSFVTLTSEPGQR